MSCVAELEDIRQTGLYWTDNYSVLERWNPAATYLRLIGHSQHLVPMAVNLAGLCGVADTNIFQLAVSLHDVGKTVRNYVYLPNTGISDRQKIDLIAKHPEEGVRLLCPALSDCPKKQWKEIQKMAYSDYAILAVGLLHHVDFCRGGYPNVGVHGADLPLEARIMRVVDCFDAMTTTRHYQRSKTRKQALAQMWCKQKETACFDPDVFEAFCQTIQQPITPELVVTN